jgi:hypothetical protein
MTLKEAHGRISDVSGMPADHHGRNCDRWRRDPGDGLRTLFVNVSIGGRHVAALYPATALLSAAARAIGR